MITSFQNTADSSSSAFSRATCAHAYLDASTKCAEVPKVPFPLPRHLPFNKLWSDFAEVEANSATRTAPTPASATQRAKKMLTILRGSSFISDGQISHMKFLKKSVDEGLISANTAKRGILVWWKIVSRTDFKVAIPAASAGPDNLLLYYWDTGPHHLELEFDDDGTVEAFYRNRDTEESWSELVFEQNGDSIPEKLLARLVDASVSMKRR